MWARIWGWQKVAPKDQEEERKTGGRETLRTSFAGLIELGERQFGRIGVDFYIDIPMSR